MWICRRRRITNFIEEVRRCIGDRRTHIFHRHLRYNEESFHAEGATGPVLRQNLLSEPNGVEEGHGYTDISDANDSVLEEALRLNLPLRKLAKAVGELKVSICHQRHSILERHAANWPGVRFAPGRGTISK